ncbi:hypothetical protein NDU88_003020 [Pleurodeles waltl]|uniref:Uncharacterized protein n=1 Tax=Pleurodeles waltl TaxID=8319 RepID=A0AAV7VEL8_PLEWA|nr:hypothetical protein NDU88_003020 [Pleurodeles waltl]
MTSLHLSFQSFPRSRPCLVSSAVKQVKRNRWGPRQKADIFGGELCRISFSVEPRTPPTSQQTHLYSDL